MGRRVSPHAANCAREGRRRRRRDQLHAAARGRRGGRPRARAGPAHDGHPARRGRGRRRPAQRGGHAAGVRGLRGIPRGDRRGGRGARRRDPHERGAGRRQRRRVRAGARAAVRVRGADDLRRARGAPDLPGSDERPAAREPHAGARHRRRQHRDGGRARGQSNSSSRRSWARCATPSATCTPTRPRRASWRPAAPPPAPSSRRRCRRTCAGGCARASRWPARRRRSPPIELGLDPYDPDRVEGHRLTLAACERILGELAALPVAERRQVTGLHPDRAPTIVAGGAILVEAMRLFGLDEIEVSERDILHGAALEAAERRIKAAQFAAFWPVAWNNRPVWGIPAGTRPGATS